VLPGWLAGSYAAGQVITVDFGTPSDGASSFAYTFYRNGVAIPGAQGTTASRYQTYVAVASDSGAIISCRVVAANSLGSSAAMAFGGIYVN
jgi:hypothetical protein